MITTAPRSLRGIHWFKLLSDEILRELEQASAWAELAGCDALWREGEVARHFTFIARGLVQVTRLNGRGVESTLALFGPGEGVGNVAAMDQGPYPASATAASTPLTIVRIPSDKMREMMQSHPTMMSASNRAFVANTRALRTKIDVLTAGPISARLAVLFLHLAERFGDEPLEGGLFIPIQLSRACLARLIGAREETTIRVLTVWRQRGWVSTTPRGFHIHAPDKVESAVYEDELP